MSKAHGMSAATLAKESLFATCINDAMAASGRGPFLGFDLDSGPGENAINGHRVCGTTLLALRAYEKRHRPGYWWANDKSKRQLAALRSRIPMTRDLFGGGVDVRLVCSDHAIFAKSIPQRIIAEGFDLRQVRGIIIADPNGLHVPTGAIRQAVAAVPGLDVLIHLCALYHQRQHRRNNPDDPRFIANPDRTVTSLNQVWAIKKRCWLVGVIPHNRMHHVLYGSDRWLRELHRPGLPAMVRVDSPEGAEIVRELH